MKKLEQPSPISARAAINPVPVCAMAKQQTARKGDSGAHDQRGARTVSVDGDAHGNLRKGETEKESG